MSIDEIQTTLDKLLRDSPSLSISAALVKNMCYCEKRGDIMSIDEIQTTLDKLFGEPAGFLAYNKFLAAGCDFKLQSMMETLLNLCLQGIDYHRACDLVLENHWNLGIIELELRREFTR